MKPVFLRVPRVLIATLAAVALSLPLTAHLRGQDAARAADSELADLAFMAGCWRGAFGGNGVMEETYTSSSENVMLGMARYLRDGQTLQFEFTLIEKRAEGVFLVPYPNGRASADAFRLTSLEDGTATFVAPEHDYPKRIIYSARRDGSLAARIDAGPSDPEPRIWQLSRIGCPPSQGP